MHRTDNKSFTPRLSGLSVLTSIAYSYMKNHKYDTLHGSVDQSEFNSDSYEKIIIAVEV